jgi:2-dehydropantoate 2-reductase
MKIVMMATGGVGGYYGARLAAAGEDVRFIARGAHLAALRTSGLKLISANGDLHLRSVQATDDPATIGAADIVIFAVKQYDTEAAAKLIVRLIADETAVISIQNGMDPQERLRTIAGDEHVMGRHDLHHWRESNLARHYHAHRFNRTPCLRRVRREPQLAG